MDPEKSGELRNTAGMYKYTVVVYRKACTVSGGVHHYLMMSHIYNDCGLTVSISLTEDYLFSLMSPTFATYAVNCVNPL